MNGRYLASTIVIGIFLLISLFLVVCLIPLNLSEITEGLANSIHSSNDGAGGEMNIVGALFAAPMLGIIFQFAYISAFLCIINSVISLPFSIRNRKSYSTAISIINYCYIVLLASIIVFSNVKLILFLTRIG